MKVEFLVKSCLSYREDTTFMELSQLPTPIKNKER